MKKALLLLTVLCSWTGLILIGIDTLYLKEPENLKLTTANFFSYFTIQSNIIVALFSTYLLFYENKFRLWEKVIMIGSVVNISITGIVYVLILSHTWNPEGFTLVADSAIHYVTPIIYVLTWFIALEKVKMNYKIGLLWVIYPLAYFVYTLSRGQFVDWYPYPFIDPREVSNTQLAFNSILLSFAFVAAGVFFVWVNNWLASSKGELI
jgi:hypothetical protein